MRCVDLGRCAAVLSARKRAVQRPQYQLVHVIARNARWIGDTGCGARFGLSSRQVDRLRAGESLSFEDSLGRITFGCSKIEDEREK